MDWMPIGYGTQGDDEMRRVLILTLTAVLVLALPGCKKDTQTGPAPNTEHANVVFAGWYSIVPDPVGSLETAYGYAKNEGAATAHSVRYVVNGLANDVSPTTLQPQGMGAFSIRVGKGTESSYTPTFTWAE